MFNPEIHHRKSIRLQEYDYSEPGPYFVTACIYNMEKLLGKIVEGEINLNQYGEIVKRCWDYLPKHYENMILDAFVIMPNHVHGIILLSEIGPEKGKKVTLSEVIRGFKTYSARRINDLRKTKGVPVWKRNYYEHIVRNEEELHNIREYIINNPLGWEKDEYFR